MIQAAKLECELEPTLGKVKVKVKGKLSEKSVPPISTLGPKWWKATGIDDASYRLARAVTGITAWGELQVGGRQCPSVECLRANLLPVVRPWGDWEWYDAKRHKGFRNTSVWSRGASLETNLAAVLRRRLIDAQRGSGDGLPLWSSYGAQFEDLLAFWHCQLDEERLADLIHGFALINFWNWTPGSKRQERMDDWQEHLRERSETPDIDTSGMWFDEDDIPRGKFRLPSWLNPEGFDAACELPRVYHLLKLCFVGGRLPRRPVEEQTVLRTGEEPFPPSSLDVFTLLQAGRWADAVQLAARRLRAKGYPTMLRDGDLRDVDMEPDECRRLAGMLLIPVRQPGVCAALAIKPQTNARP